MQASSCQLPPWVQPSSYAELKGQLARVDNVLCFWRASVGLDDAPSCGQHPRTKRNVRTLSHAPSTMGNSLSRAWLDGSATVHFIHFAPPAKRCRANFTTPEARC